MSGENRAFCGFRPLGRERLAAELQTSRSQLYSRALLEFVARHAPDRLTEAMNRVVDEVGPEVDEFSQRAAYRVLERVEW